MGISAVLILGGCGSESATTATSILNAEASIPAAVGWRELSDDQYSNDYEGRWWRVSGCCLEGYSADFASPDMTPVGPLADGRYAGYLMGFDPTGVGSVTVRVSPLRDCSLPEMQQQDVCSYIVEPGVRFEPGGPSRDIVVPLDDSFWVMVYSNAEDPVTRTGLAFRTAFGKGPDLRELLITLRDDFDTYVAPLVAAGVSEDEIAQGLMVDGSPFGATFDESGYGMARWWREGFPALSYWEGSASDLVAPKSYDPTTDKYVTSTFENFIKHGGSFEVRDGITSFAYAWEFIGG